MLIQQKRRALLINHGDNVAIALENIPAGANVLIVGHDREGIIALHQIPFGHKIAIFPIERGSPILKYGVPIAFALVDIAMGEWIHMHNAKSYFVVKREGEAP